MTKKGRYNMKLLVWTTEEKLKMMQEDFNGMKLEIANLKEQCRCTKNNLKNICIELREKGIFRSE